MAGLYDSDKMETVASGLTNNPRLVASKLAYSIFPDDCVKPLMYGDKKLADAPEALWSEAEIKLYGQPKADLPVVQSQGDSASDKQEKKAEVATADDKTADDKTAEEEEEIYEPGGVC